MSTHIFSCHLSMHFIPLKKKKKKIKQDIKQKNKKGKGVWEKTFQIK